MSIWVDILLALGLVFAIGILWAFLQQVFGLEKENKKRELGPKKGIDSIGVAVVFFCHDGAGKYLVSKRSMMTRDEQGCWEPGSGAVDFGEHVEDAVRREMQEEYNATAISLEYLGVRDVHRALSDGRETHWIALDYKVRIDPAGVVIGEPEMIDEVRWVELADIPTPRHSQFSLFLEKYKDKL